MRRYTEYSQVPWNQKQEICNLFIIIGLFIAPFLWYVCFVSLTSDVYYNKKDSEGYIKKWGTGNKVAAAILLVLQLISLISLVISPSQKPTLVESSPSSNPENSNYYYKA